MFKITKRIHNYSKVIIQNNQDKDLSMDENKNP